MTSPFIDLLRQAASPPVTDPLARLMDPAFTQVLWLYENSRTEPEIPGKLHPKQLEMLLSPARHRWLFWGNQVGKTALGAVDLALLCLGRHPVQKWQPPVYCWASALTWELWENILLPELLTWLPPDRVIDAPSPRSKSMKRIIRIRADNGSESQITGKAAEQGAERYQSARIHRVWLDEEHPEAVYNEMQPRLLRYGGDTLATMTPLKGLTWVYDRVYEPWKNNRLEARAHFCSHAGLKDNPSMKQEQIDEITNELRHNPALLEARLYGHFVRPTGSVLPYDPNKHLTDLSRDRINQLIATGTVFAGLDLGKWRWALSLYVADRVDGIVYLIDELFSQNEDIDTRAGKLHELYTSYGIDEDRITTRADCADPKALRELNDALERIGSPYYVMAVDARLKIIKVGVERIESLLNRGAFKVRRGLGDGHVWRLGMHTAAPGKPVEGSRWIWEINNWQYPKTPDGKIQKDEPDDASADGADMMDSCRYAILSWWEVDQPKAPTEKAPTVAERLLKEIEDMDKPPVTRYGRTLRQG